MIYAPYDCACVCDYATCELCIHILLSKYTDELYLYHCKYCITTLQYQLYHINLEAQHAAWTYPLLTQKKQIMMAKGYFTMIAGEKLTVIYISEFSVIKLVMLFLLSFIYIFDFFFFLI